MFLGLNFDVYYWLVRLLRLRRRDGLDSAYGPRHKTETQLRRLKYRVLKALGLRRHPERADYFEFFPPVENAKEFADLSARAYCYLGDAELPMFLPGNRFELTPDLVPYMDPALVRDPGWVASRPAGRPKLVIHRTSGRALGRMLTHRGAGATVVDKDLFLLSELNYWHLRNQVAWPNFPSADTSLERLMNRFNDASNAFILATGPSSRTVDLSAVEADVRITCNSAIQDFDWLDDFSPNVIAFTDPVFHFGPSKYAAAFRSDVLEAVERFDPILMSGSDWVSPLLHLIPELRDRMAVIPTLPGGRWRWPTPRNPTIRSSDSVLTNLMLPVALALTDDVEVAGVDGRQPGENYFWKHGTQYSDELMKTVFDAHPAFFRDRDYADYYELYCENIEEIIQVAEASGKRVRPAAPSWIPAFQRRGAESPS